MKYQDTQLAPINHLLRSVSKESCIYQYEYEYITLDVYATWQYGFPQTETCPEEKAGWEVTRVISNNVDITSAVDLAAIQMDIDEMHQRGEI